MATGVKAQEAYAVYDNDSQVVTFYYDNQKASHGNVGPINNSSSNYPVYRYATKAVFDPSFAAYRPTDAAYWFAYCNSLESIVDLKYLNTEDVTSMRNMFMGCRNLNALDLRSFNTAKVTDMQQMFYGCSALTTLDLSSFNTAKVTDMQQMFNVCEALTTLDLSNFNTENVTDMRAMFRNCSNLTSLNLSGFDTRNVTSMLSMFLQCEKLTALDLGTFNTAKVTNMQTMFYNCSSLTTLDLSSFNTEKVTSMEQMFYNCSSLTTLDLSSFNTAKVTDMANMFQGCNNLTTLDLSSFNTVNVTYMNQMFTDCDKLTSIDLSNFNTENVTQMGGMFQGCSTLNTLDLSSFNTRNVTAMNNMFSYDEELTTIYVSEGWTTEKVEAGYVTPFVNCVKLVGGVGTSYANMYELDYSNCKKLIYARIDTPSTPGYLTDKTGAPGPVVLAGNSDGAGNYWATYYNNVAGFVADENTTVYTAKVSDDKTKVVLTEVADRSVPLTYAVILKSTEEEMTLTYKKDITDVLPDNDLKGSGFDIDTPENTYMLAKGVKGVGFYHWTGSTIPAHRGYLTISGAAASRFLGFDDGTEDTTAIKGAQTEGIGDSPLYDLTGRRVEGQPQKGIYVKDGKKVFVK